MNCQAGDTVDWSVGCIQGCSWRSVEGEIGTQVIKRLGIGSIGDQCGSTLDRQSQCRGRLRKPLAESFHTWKLTEVHRFLKRLMISLKVVPYALCIFLNHVNRIDQVALVTSQTAQ